MKRRHRRKKSIKEAIVKDFGNTFVGKHKRSKFAEPFKITTAFNVGELIPLDVVELLPGDYVNIDLNALLRTTTAIRPTMDTLTLDLMVFAGQNRLVWDDYAKFFGENENEWARIQDVKIPTTSAPKGGWKHGTIAEYLGIRPLIEKDVNSLPLRMYAKVVNDWFRDQNLQKSAFIRTDSRHDQGTNEGDYVTNLSLGAKPFIANKYHDYFTSALPSQQKGQAPTFSIGGQAPVKFLQEDSKTPVKLYGSGLNLDEQPKWIMTTAVRKGETNITTHTGAQKDGEASNFALNWPKAITDLSASAGVSVNDLRAVITIQQMMELDARGGTRYTEYLQSHFGVNNGDSRLQRTEYLGGFSKPLNIQQVPSTANISGKDSVGDLGAYSQSLFQGQDRINYVSKEHGYLMIMAVVRYKHTYQQGISRLWTRSTKYDVYDPIFANISEQPIRNDEIFARGENMNDDMTFGFKEAWSEYRHHPSRVSGYMRSDAPQSLDVYHYADNYKELPKLSSSWIQEDLTNVDRTLVLKSSDNTPQIQADFYINLELEREMPISSIPGLTRL